MSTPAKQMTLGTPCAVVRRNPSAYEDVYDGWLEAQLSRMPYLRKGLVSLAIRQMLVPELSQSLDRLISDTYLEGWRDGFGAATRAAGGAA